MGRRTVENGKMQRDLVAVHTDLWPPVCTEPRDARSDGIFPGRWEVKFLPFVSAQPPDCLQVTIFILFLAIYDKGRNEHGDLIATCQSRRVLQLWSTPQMHLVHRQAADSAFFPSHSKPIKPSSSSNKPLPFIKVIEIKSWSDSAEEGSARRTFEGGLQSDNTRNGGTWALAMLSVSAFMNLLTRLMCISTFTCNTECLYVVCQGFFVVCFWAKCRMAK